MSSICKLELEYPDLSVEQLYSDSAYVVLVSCGYEEMDALKLIPHCDCVGKVTCIKSTVSYYHKRQGSPL